MPDYIRTEKTEALYDFSKACNFLVNDSVRGLTVHLQNIIHDILTSEALEKSSGRCHLTNDTNDVVPFWIFPPTYGELVRLHDVFDESNVISVETSSIRPTTRL